MREEQKTRMPLWGPYSKKYMGLSRMMKESRICGARFDLVVYPTYANSSVPVPNVTVPSGYHPFACDNEGNYYRYRYELIWKDQLYADVDLFAIDEETWGICVDYHNQTQKPQNCLLNFFAAIEYPMKWFCRPVLPQKNEFWDALDYKEFYFQKDRPWKHLSPDALRPGEVSVPEFTNGCGLGETFYHLMASHLSLKWFGGDKGDGVSWHRTLSDDYQNAVLTVRYKTPLEQGDVPFTVTFGEKSQTLFFPASKEAASVVVPLGELKKGEFDLRMCAGGTDGNGVVLDYLCITEANEAGKIENRMEQPDVIPEITREDGQEVYRYRYGEAPIYFSIENPRVRRRKLNSGCLEDALITRLTNSDHTYDDLTRSFTGSFSEKHSDDGFYDNHVVEAIFLQGGESRREYAWVSTKKVHFSHKELEELWKKRAAAAKETGHNPEGEPYELSVRLLKSALFTNVVYPIFRHGEPIAHYTPGKRWDSLYTWDSGFIGLGMLEYSPEKAEYIMDVYLSEEENTDFAFLFHGSLIPTQFYLYYEMMQKAAKEKRSDLKKYYPMFRRAWRFYSGRSEGSFTGRIPGDLLTPYDYFYNASGMDDYPPQVALHREHLEKNILPVCTNAHFIRFSKMMIQIAKQFGYEEDIREYQEACDRVSKALLEKSWDEDSGYFGYVLYREEDQTWEILRTPEGENYNKGVDGITPLIDGICSLQQEQKLLAHLKSEQELMSPVGISTVDMSASYYYDNGYWNGSVWFPYQYLIWKALLDIGENALAFQVAQRALSAWKQEVDFSYNTFEMIQIATAQGGWFHQFGGLSAPIAIWYQAYYRRGTVTAGFETWIESAEFTEDVSEAKVSYRLCSRKENRLVVVMNSAYDYQVTQDGEPVQWEEHVKGALEIHLPGTAGELVITRKC
ncbi:MAG: trehalase family glycosidase [Fusicatenibacter sp.]|nr:trehalase family glycosidase [Lachnospiraceae bacterium]MDY2938926.1 trehalase family glycosidase [Fusicatenibacter sp.]